MSSWTAEQAKEALDLLVKLLQEPTSSRLRSDLQKLERRLRTGPLVEPAGTLTASGRKAKRHLEELVLALHGLSLLSSARLPPEGQVLVIGSAHFDILCDYSAWQETQVDKIGTIFISVGGSAFNIAADLVHHRVPAALFTYLRDHALATELIESQCHRLGIQTQFVARTSSAQADTAFVAHRRDGDLVSAVTSTRVDKVVFDEDLLHEAMTSCRFAIADCNLTAEQLGLVARLAAAADKELLVAGVSESKAERVLAVPPPANRTYAFDVFSLNEAEARQVFKCDLAPRQAQHLCKMARSRNVVVTRGAEGYDVYTAAGRLLRFPAPRVPRVVSITGAGDALVAAIGVCLFQDGKIDWDRVTEVGATLIAEVLATPGSTMEAQDPFAPGGVVSAQLGSAPAPH